MNRPKKLKTHQGPDAIKSAIYNPKEFRKPRAGRQSEHSNVRQGNWKDVLIGLAVPAAIIVGLIYFGLPK